MNKLFLRHLALAALLSLPVIGGCKPADAIPTPGTNSVAEAFPAAPSAPATAIDASSGEPTDKLEIATEPAQPEVPFAVERPLPENLNPSVPLKEIIKLAQAGVDEEVLLTFVNNATSGFYVGADEIIYLTDIGVPGTVINSMLERDKALKTAQVMTSAPAPTATTATTAIAAAPTYVQPPDATPTEAQPENFEVTVTEDNFYEALSPYGTWIEVEGYGRCWQPTVVVADRNWRPYCDNGRWMYTDAGWYWYSDYSWGWAPFHYGRWFAHPRWGWCWNPGYTWGPAWVTWSYTDSYCGWAPLPPAAVYTSSGFTYCGSSVSVSFGFGLGYSCYSYVPWRNFCDYRPWRYCAPRPHCKEIYSKATCHNDYAYDRNRRAVNRGVPPERVAALSRTEVRRVSLRDVPETRSVTGRGEELTRDGRTLAVRRPVAGATPRTVSATTPSRSSTGHESVLPPPSNASPRTGQRERPVAAQVNGSVEESVNQGAPASRPGNNGRSGNTPARATRSAQPLVVIGNGDGRPPTPSTWRPPVEPAPRRDLASAPSAEVDAPQAPTELPHTTPPANAPTHTRNQPVRQDVESQRPSQVIRVGRGIEDRPSGSPSYRVYSTPQRETPSAPSYGPPPTVNTPAPDTRSSPSRPSSRSNDDDNNNVSNNYQPPRQQQQPTYEAPRQVERNAPQQRPAQVESRPASTPERPAPARSEPSRSESRPSQSDSGRGSRNR